jgi:hypothetical protein
MIIQKEKRGPKPAFSIFYDRLQVSQRRLPEQLSLVW